MKKICKLISVLSLLTTSVLFAAPRGEQDFIPAGHWVYSAMHQLELESGKITFADEEPMSIQEFKLYFNEIDYNKLSSAGQKQYERILEYFKEKNWSFDAGILSLGIEPEFNAEFYSKTDKDIAWVYDYTKKKPVFSLPVKVTLGDYATLVGDINFGQTRWAQEQWMNFSNYQLFGLEYIDSMVIHNSYLSAGYKWDEKCGVNLRIGLGPQKYGNSLMESSILSEYLTDTMYGQFKFYSPKFNYEFNITELTTKTMLYSHRIGFKFWDRFTLSLIEGILPYDRFEFRYLAPFSHFHGYGQFMYDKEYQSYFGFKFDVVPCDFLRIYGLYSQNEIQIPTESDVKIPNGMGIQAGVQTNFPLNNGYFYANLEGYYATPYMFVRYHPNNAFARVYDEINTRDFGAWYEWMGNQFGPDTAAGKLKVGFELPGKWAVEGSYTFAAMGNNAGYKLFRNADWKANTFEYNAAAWPYKKDQEDKIADDVSPTGTPQFVNVLAVKGQLEVLPYLTIVAQPAYTFIFNYDNVPGEFRQGFEFSVSARFKPIKLPGAQNLGKDKVALK
ncbi:MAG: hypothetical protein MJ169_05945 [Treponema sp.]|nr:hypothetical protein [Treponema sp.]